MVYFNLVPRSSLVLSREGTLDVSGHVPPKISMLDTPHTYVKRFTFLPLRQSVVNPQELFYKLSFRDARGKPTNDADP